MRNLVIAGIVMPRTRDIEVGQEPEEIESKMASGKYVKDYIGYRISITANWEWIPADTLTEIVTAVKSGRYLQIDYPAPDVDGSERFKIEIGPQKIFKFKNGEPMWYNVSLKAIGQEVHRAKSY